MCRTEQGRCIATGLSLIAFAGMLAAGCTSGSGAPVTGTGPCCQSIDLRLGSSQAGTKIPGHCAKQRARNERLSRTGIEELQRLEQLRRNGVLTRDEHRVARQRALDCI